MAEIRRKVCPYFGQKCVYKIKHYCCKPKYKECYKELKERGNVE